MICAACLSASAEPTDVPPNFITSVCVGIVFSFGVPLVS
jgi:hypothetical protein